MDSLSPSTKSRSLAIPAWISLSVHIAIVVLAGLSLKGCRDGVPAPAGGRDFRTVGLASVPDKSVNETSIAEQNPHNDTDVVQPSEVEATTDTTTFLPTEAPSIAEMTGQNPLESTTADSTFDSDLPNIIGAGIPIGGVPDAGGGLPDLIRPAGTSGLGAAGSPTPGPGETAFMDIIGNGQNFVYVIDVSASMGNEGKLQLAKSQLKGSLRLLKPFQTFQILFYNESTLRMRLRPGRPALDRYQATAVNLQLAENKIKVQPAKGGTVHQGAILQALVLEPDVVYFLTDGDKPSLTREELARIRSSNRSGAKIHVVEFATGPRETRRVSWMEVLSSQSGGRYRRININGQ